jgi:hypothetical protein
VHSLPSRAPCGALVSILLVVCLQGLPYNPLGLSLVVRYNPTSYSLCAIASPSPRELVYSPASPTNLVAIQSIHRPIASIWPLV